MGFTELQNRTKIQRKKNSIELRIKCRLYRHTLIWVLTSMLGYTSLQTTMLQNSVEENTNDDDNSNNESNKYILANGNCIK